MTIEMWGSAPGFGATRGFSTAATAPPVLRIPAGYEGSCFHDVVLDGAVGPAPVPAQRPDAPLLQLGDQPGVLGERALGDVDVGRVHHHRVLGDELLPRGDA